MKSRFAPRRFRPYQLGERTIADAKVDCDYDTSVHDNDLSLPDLRRNGASEGISNTVPFECLQVAQTSFNLDLLFIRSIAGLGKPSGFGASAERGLPDCSCNGRFRQLLRYWLQYDSERRT